MWGNVLEVFTRLVWHIIIVLQGGMDNKPPFGPRYLGMPPGHGPMNTDVSEMDEERRRFHMQQQMMASHHGMRPLNPEMAARMQHMQRPHMPGK